MGGPGNRLTSGTIGDYELALILNAAVEMEEHDGVPSDSPATAQDLDAGFVASGSGPAERNSNQRVRDPW